MTALLMLSLLPNDTPLNVLNAKCAGVVLGVFAGVFIVAECNRIEMAFAEEDVKAVI